MGAVLGGLGALILLGVGELSTTVALVALALGSLAGLALDLARRGGHVPSWRRQVDERWLTTYRGWVYGVGYGLQLGTGAATIIPASTTYVVGLAAVLTGSPAAGALIGAVFGATRAVPLLLTARVRTPAALTRVMQRMAAAHPSARLATGTGQALVAAVAVALVLV